MYTYYVPNIKFKYNLSVVAFNAELITVSPRTSLSILIGPQNITVEKFKFTSLCILFPCNKVWSVQLVSTAPRVCIAGCKAILHLKCRPILFVWMLFLWSVRIYSTIILITQSSNPFYKTRLTHDNPTSRLYAYTLKPIRYTSFSSVYFGVKRVINIPFSIAYIVVDAYLFINIVNNSQRLTKQIIVEHVHRHDRLYNI